ncbi:glutamate synthase conserved region-containing protein [Streptomyces sp. 2314.4]|nr:glutamate synthase conserved region-containing protein [Streptomyces sp. 2314.4]
MNGVVRLVAQRARQLSVGALLLLAVGFVAASVRWSPWYGPPAVLFLALGVLGVADLTQRRHSVLRNYPVIGHLRFALEALRPELQQYFIERNFDGRPFDRDVRTLVYERAKGVDAEEPFGTERDVYATGYEYLVPSMAPEPVPEQPPTVRIGGPDCTKPYDMALLNVSAMSFGSLSANAVLALNKGAAMGGFAHDTGEGGLSEYHLRHGGDLIWEIGTGYFGCRTADGEFAPSEFAEKAAHEHIRCISLKISQGAKPGIGGVLPGGKVNAEIARVREVPQGPTVQSPPYHRTFSTPRGRHSAATPIPARSEWRPRIRAGAGPWTSVTSPRACTGSRRQRCTAPCRSWAPWASGIRTACGPGCCTGGSIRSPSGRTRSSTTGCAPASCRRTRRRTGPRTGRRPTPIISVSETGRFPRSERHRALNWQVTRIGVFLLGRRPLCVRVCRTRREA